MAPPSPAPRNKLVIRRLPPTLPEDIFWNAVSTWITDKSCLCKSYVAGKAPNGNLDSHPVHSRAYVLMSDPEALVNFHRGFDGHVFRSKTGAEFQAVVEYAPYQKTVHKARVKPDNRQGTIDEDPDFLSFLKFLDTPAPESAQHTFVPAAPQPSTTPLLDHLRSQKSAKSKGKGKATPAPSQAPSQSATPVPTVSAPLKGKAAALASIKDASQRRHLLAQGTPSQVMVAGKGREVSIAPSTSTSPAPGSSAAGGGAKKDGKGKAKEKGDKGGEGAKETGEKGKKGRSRNRSKKDKKEKGDGAATPTDRQTPNLQPKSFPPLPQSTPKAPTPAPAPPAAAVPAAPAQTVPPSSNQRALAPRVAQPPRPPFAPQEPAFTARPPPQSPIRPPPMRGGHVRPMGQPARPHIPAMNQGMPLNHSVRPVSPRGAPPHMGLHANSPSMFNGGARPAPGPSGQGMGPSSMAPGGSGNGSRRGNRPPPKQAAQVTILARDAAAGAGSDTGASSARIDM
ncbi:hypothetical protein L198_00234 [Cryptococcus wingfieldii CBS 7118]|uniref:UPF3 domain-containing protein n=1 Tax=Cryptococcus wingfieldii CBS 7118 TaxID=1295528 RepID=A0A1E3K5Q3_9TREE|nr:hypothetical protein L198_00234 [Cryptococcus wingfieldii CBS 7118]ODO08504.1 hypothetical protein L198_00234 [Cryptococcus wingfieldii CBS 7118]